MAACNYDETASGRWMAPVPTLPLALTAKVTRLEGTFTTIDVQRNPSTGGFTHTLVG